MWVTATHFPSGDKAMPRSPWLPLGRRTLARAFAVWRVEHGDFGGDVGIFVVERLLDHGQVVRHEQPRAVGSERQRDGLAQHGRLPHVSRFQIKEGDRMVEAAGDVQRLAVGAEQGRQGGVAEALLAEDGRRCRDRASARGRRAQRW
jgi:hypothetical protein